MDLLSLSLLSLLNAAPATEPLCVNRAPCSVVKTSEAGKDAQGKTLQVKHLALGWATQGDSGGKKITGARKEQGSWSDGQCEAAEWWLLRAGSAPQLLLAVCNDGYGASGVGEDEVTVGNNRFTHTQNGGSADRWSQSATIQLSPPRLLSHETGYYSVLRQDRAGGLVWDLEKFQGSHRVAAPACGEEDEDGEQKPPARDVYASKPLTIPLLPQVNLDTSYLQEGWKTTGLGSCALEAKAFVLGKAGSPQDLALKVLLASADTLMLEVRDDHWTGPSDKWLADDHVELWLDASNPGELNECTPPTAEQKPVQWGIRVTDGKAFPGYGSPQKSPQVEKVELREGTSLVGYRLKVVLPQPFKGISVLYSDSDSGKKQERLLGTSAVKYPRPETLNEVQVVTPQQATCEVRAGALAVKPTLPTVGGPDTAVMSLWSE